MEAAVVREREMAAARVLAEREAAHRLAEAAREAERQAADWRQRYREALREPGCREWSEQPVGCPL